MKIQTNTATATRRSINKVLNLVLSGDIDPRVGNCLLYGLNISISALRAIDLQRRIEEIEDILSD